MMSPCVLWLDEIEKGVSSGVGDQGTSQRLLGTLLTWMAERTSLVFMVATSNDISQLPPELVRKGRLDEIFFVDLPDSATRELIFKIHLERRRETIDRFNLEHLAVITDGFSGAEIEQLVVSALYKSAAREEVLEISNLTDAINSTNPLSIVMEEKITSLRRWAEGRTVQAG